jgi:hypothetical protein
MIVLCVRYTIPVILENKSLIINSNQALGKLIYGGKSIFEQNQNESNCRAVGWIGVNMNYVGHYIYIQ